MATKVKPVSTEALEIQQLRKQFDELLETINLWRLALEQAKQLPHAGKKIEDLGSLLLTSYCDAPRGECRRCEEWETAIRGHRETVTAFNRVSRRLNVRTEELRSKVGRDVSRQKGAESRARTLTAAIEAFGIRPWLKAADLRKRVRGKLSKLTDRTIERHLNHPDVGEGLRKAGKKII